MEWPSWRILCTGLWALALTSCSALPEYAAPKGRIADPAKLDMSDVIAYRTLARSDFKSEKPPDQFSQYVDRIGAATCAHILTTTETQVLIHPIRQPDGKIVYRAVPDGLGFHAQMDRNCSWWNPKNVGLPADYVLEHEQIHFAIFELGARRLNRAVPEIERHLTATADSPEAANEIVQRELERQLEDRLKRVLARSREFDEDTSMGHRPDQQKRWWKRVHSELGVAGD